MTPARIRLTGLEVGHGGVTAVRAVEGVFGPGAATAIVGPNGSGKSSLLKAMAGLIPPRAGAVALEGAHPGEIAYLAQDSGIDRGFPIRLSDFVGLGFEPRLGLFRGIGRAERAVLAEALARVGLAGLEARPIAALSGGQFQRALFARVMVQAARIILLDEPFTALDQPTTEDLTAVVAGWAAEGRTVVMVQHDLALVRALCGQTLVLAGEPVAWGPTAEVLTAPVLRRARLQGAAAA